MDELKLLCRAEGHWWHTDWGWGARSRDGNGVVREHKNNSTWHKTCVRDGVGCGTTVVAVRGPQAQHLGATSHYDDEYKLPGSKPDGGTRAEARRELLNRRGR
jgi:hypothetical protein